jgi:hypothetical protein
MEFYRFGDRGAAHPSRRAVEVSIVNCAKN